MPVLLDFHVCDSAREVSGVLLGEFPGRTAGTTPAAVVAAARGAGYAGALIWSMLSDDDQSGYEPLST